MYYIIPPWYEDQSAFTQIPSSIGTLIFTIPALVFGGTASIIDPSLGAKTGLGVVRIGSTVAGAPFYVLEKAFYDVPNALFSGNKSIQNNATQPGNAQIENLHESHSNTKTHTEQQSEVQAPPAGEIVQIEPIDLSKLNCPTRTVNGIEEVIMQAGMSGMNYAMCQEKIRRKK